MSITERVGEGESEKGGRIVATAIIVERCEKVTIREKYKRFKGNSNWIVLKSSETTTSGDEDDGQIGE